MPTARPIRNFLVREYFADLPLRVRSQALRLRSLVVRELPGCQEKIQNRLPFYRLERDVCFIVYQRRSDLLQLGLCLGRELTDPNGRLSGTRSLIKFLHIFQDQPLDKALISDFLRQSRQLVKAGHSSGSIKT